VDASEEGVVLPHPPSWLPHGYPNNSSDHATDDAHGRSSTSGSVQLRCGFRKLDGWLVRG
jgi:hypothetical protein